MPTDLYLAVKIGVYVLMGASLLAAAGVVLLPNLFHSALALAAALLGIAGIYLALGAEFLAAVQVLIYVGAVMTLVIFAIMLTQRIGDTGTGQNNRLVLPAFIGASIFLGALSQVIHSSPWHIKASTTAVAVSTLDLGEALMGPYVFPFEIISVILIASLVGAVIIAKKNSE